MDTDKKRVRGEGRNVGRIGIHKSTWGERVACLMHVFQLFQGSRIHGAIPSIDLRVPAVLFELRTSLSGLMLFLYPFDLRGRGSAGIFKKW